MIVGLTQEAHQAASRRLLAFCGRSARMRRALEKRNDNAVRTQVGLPASGQPMTGACLRASLWIKKGTLRVVARIRHQAATRTGVPASRLASLREWLGSQLSRRGPRCESLSPNHRAHTDQTQRPPWRRPWPQRPAPCCDQMPHSAATVTMADSRPSPLDAAEGNPRCALPFCCAVSCP